MNSLNHCREKRRLLHTSDMHLERPGDKACQSLDAMVNLAIKLEVNLVIVAGDFFDHNRVEDALVKFAAEQLGRLEIPVVILPGNHDCLIPGSVYDRKSLWNACRNLRLIREPSGQTIDFPELEISVWGKPIVSYIDDTRPLAGIPPPENGWWHIGVAHGDPYQASSYGFTVEEIASSGRDYIALGHWPTFRCVCSSPVKAYYCDSPSWAFPQSTVNIVDLADGEEVQVRQCPLLNS